MPYYLRLLHYLRLLPLIAVLLGVVPLAGAADNVLSLEGYLDMERVAGRGLPAARISPDGKQIIYARMRVDRKTDKMTSALWLMNADGSHNRELLKGSVVRWSPDGTRIAYIARATDGSRQIFVRWMDAEGNVTQVTHSANTPNQLAWSPDGRHIAFRATVPYRNDWKFSLPGRPKGAKWTPDVTVIDRIHYRQDRRGPMKGFEHIFLVPADSGTSRALTSGDWYVGARFSGLDSGTPIVWSRDGAEILFDGVREKDWEKRFLESRIYAVNVESGAIRRLTKAEGNWSTPVVSPDGKKIAYVGYDLAKARKTYAQADLYVMNRDGGNVRRLTSGLAGAPGQLKWAPDNSGVYFIMNDAGSSNLQFASLGGKVRAVTRGAQMLGLAAIASRRVAYGSRQSAGEPGDLVRIDLKSGALTELTHVNDDVLFGKKLAALKEIDYQAPDGRKVQGWLQLPPDFDATKKYPLILQIHGGPHGMYNVAFSYMRQLQAADGYVVLYTNPRGSIGYGEEFANLIDNDYPGPDFQDLMAGVDAAIGQGFVDKNRLYVWGCSGGGVLTSWTVSHTDRFKAAAALCPVIDWISFAGTADIVAWGYKRFDGFFWDDPSKWLSHSPLMHVGNVHTPTLLMTGDRDLRTPLSQAEEFYSALKMLGVPTKLVVIHGEFHGTTSIPSNFMRTYLILKRWFGEHGGVPAATKAN